MGTTDIMVFVVSGNTHNIDETACYANATSKRQCVLNRVDNVELSPLSSSLLYVIGNSSSRNDSLSRQLDHSGTPLEYIQRRNPESKSAGSSNKMGRIEIGMSRVHANDDDVGETSHSANATSKRQRVSSRPYNVGSSIFSSRPPYVGDNSSRPTDNFSGHPDRSGSTLQYKHIGGCDRCCEHCGACFWYEERIKDNPRNACPKYHRCCMARTTHEKFLDSYVSDFKVRLYNVIGAQEYELPTGDMLGAIVYEAGPEMEMDYDIVIEQCFGQPQRVNKFHTSYMSLQFPLLSIYEEDGYSKEMKLVSGFASSFAADRRLSMKVYYAYFLHDHVNSFNFLSRTGRLFQ
ncbi:hypothetical protein Tco_1334706 [Tanacetum coccineum]